MGDWKIMSVMLKPPKRPQKKKPCATSPCSPVLFSAQAPSDLEVVLKCLMNQSSEEIAGVASIGLYRFVTESREN